LKALKNVNREFVRLCRELGLFGREEVSIDGTFIRGNASKASIHTQEKRCTEFVEVLEKQ